MVDGKLSKKVGERFEASETADAFWTLACKAHRANELTLRDAHLRAAAHWYAKAGYPSMVHECQSILNRSTPMFSV